MCNLESLDKCINSGLHSFTDSTVCFNLQIYYVHLFSHPHVN